MGAGGAYGGMGTWALCTAGAAGAASSRRCVRQQEHADGEDGGRRANEGTRRMGKGNEMGGVAWEGRPHRSTTVVRVRGRSGRRGQQRQGAAAEFELVKLASKHARLEAWSVHAQTMSI